MEHAKLYERLTERLSDLEKFPRLKEDKSIAALMEEHGISRRDFMKWAAGCNSYVITSFFIYSLMAQAAEPTDRLPVVGYIWQRYGLSESYSRNGRSDN